jgi:hypothetical protein
MKSPSRRRPFLPLPAVRATANSASAAAAALADSLTQYGITWKFSKPARYGQFVNGDYWVLGPVEITEVSPGWDGSKNGSMLDPVPSTAQGYIVHTHNLHLKNDESLRVNFPFTIKGLGRWSHHQAPEPVKGRAYVLDTAASVVLDKVLRKNRSAPLRRRRKTGHRLPDPVGFSPSCRSPKRDLPPPRPSSAGPLDHSSMKKHRGHDSSQGNMQNYYHHEEASLIALLVLLDIPEAGDDLPADPERD